MRIALWSIGILGLVVGACAAPAAGQKDPDCSPDNPATVYAPTDDTICKYLSSYGLYTGTMADLQPADGLISYDLATPLFSDYAQKYRMVYVPMDTSATLAADGTVEFPVGTILVKTFAFARDLRTPDADRHIYETRLLVHRQKGWDVLPYIWNEDQTDATYAPLGSTVPVEWIHTDGELRSTQYGIPNRNQCKECHGYTPEGTRRKVLIPIGPKVKHLNKDYAYRTGTENQLLHWQKSGILQGVTDTTHMPALVDYLDFSAPITARSRAYLDANCAHCHNPQGAAAASGLLLDASVEDPHAWGLCKVPIRGIGDTSEFDIKPGDPDASGLINRLVVDSGPNIMPRLGRTVVHTEAVETLRAWIAQMPGDCTNYTE